MVMVMVMVPIFNSRERTLHKYECRIPSFLKKKVIREKKILMYLIYYSYICFLPKILEDWKKVLHPSLARSLEEGG